RPLSRGATRRGARPDPCESRRGRPAGRATAACARSAARSRRILPRPAGQGPVIVRFALAPALAAALAGASGHRVALAASQLPAGGLIVTPADAGDWTGSAFQSPDLFAPRLPLPKYEPPSFEPAVFEPSSAAPSSPGPSSDPPSA